jgi:glycerophosphoryl diester phosphodiesterase
MEILSHRGFHRGASLHENTLAAFERALDHGVDGIETDIRLSADEQMVLYHDRLAPDLAPVESLDRRQLEKIAGHEIPTVDDILGRWPDVFWNLEIKCSAAGRLTIERLRRHPRPDRILITSFLHDVVLRCARQLDVACGFLLAHRPADLSESLTAWVGQSPVRTIVWDFGVLDQATVACAKEDGFRTYSYGVANRDERQLCEEWGVDGIITDEPLRVRDG